MEKHAKDYSISESILEITINPKIYPLEAVLNAAYFFIEDFYIFLDQPAGALELRMKGKNRMGKARLEATAGEFFNTMLSENLRLELSKRNKTLRETILQQAITSALSPAPPDSDAGQAAPDSQQAELLELDEELKRIIEKTRDISYEEDPLGIGIPVTDEKPPAPKKRPAAKKKKK